MSSFEIFWNRVSDPATTLAIFNGLKNTMLIAVFGLLLGFIIGCILASILIMPSNNLVAKVFKRIADFYIAVFRGTPMMVQLLLMHFAVFASVRIDPVVEVSLIFGFNSGAYMAEIIRSGINAVDRGQMEAGRSLGMGYVATMIRVVLPQAIKNVVPTIGNEFISLLKETSIVSVIGLADLTMVFKSIATATYEYFIPYIALALIYFVLVLIVTLIIKLLERRFAKSEKR